MSGPVRPIRDGAEPMSPRDWPLTLHCWTEIWILLKLDVRHSQCRSWWLNGNNEQSKKLWNGAAQLSSNSDSVHFNFVRHNATLELASGTYYFLGTNYYFFCERWAKDIFFILQTFYLHFIYSIVIFSSIIYMCDFKQISSKKITFLFSIKTKISAVSLKQ